MGTLWRSSFCSLFTVLTLYCAMLTLYDQRISQGCFIPALQGIRSNLPNLFFLGSLWIYVYFVANIHKVHRGIISHTQKSELCAFCPFIWTVRHIRNFVLYSQFPISFIIVMIPEQPLVWGFFSTYFDLSGLLRSLMSLLDSNTLPGWEISTYSPF